MNAICRSGSEARNSTNSTIRKRPNLLRACCAALTLILVFDLPVSAATSPDKQVCKTAYRAARTEYIAANKQVSQDYRAAISAATSAWKASDRSPAAKEIYLTAKKDARANQKTAKAENVKNFKEATKSYKQCLKDPVQFPAAGISFVIPSGINPMPGTLEAFVSHLYSCVLDTATPDTEGYNFWLNDLRNKAISFQDIYSGFFAAQPGLVAEQFVNKLYKCALFRRPDTGGYAYWVDVLKNNKDIPWNVVKNFLASPEFLTKILPKLQALGLEQPCIPSGTEKEINAALKNSGDAAILCPAAVFLLNNPVVFTQSNQQIVTLGLPTDAKRATLRVNSGSFATAINGMGPNYAGVSGIAIKNIIVDGNRPNLGPLPRVDEPLIRLGGTEPTSGMIVDHVKAYEPRSWSTLSASWRNCSGATITNNEIGPSGQHPTADDSWSDGISLECANSVISDNIVTDATDVAIVIFGSPGTRVTNNTIIAKTRELWGGIAMVNHNDWAFGGNYTGVMVSGNTVNAASAKIYTGIAMGPRIWSCSGADGMWKPMPENFNYGGSVIRNHLTGSNFGYGFVAAAVKDWTVMGNTSDAIHSGVPSGGCGVIPPAPQPFQADYNLVSGTIRFQSEFVNGAVDNVLRLH